MTPKIVRNELQIRLKVNDLSSRKQEISAFIMDVINDINNNNNNSNNKSNSNGDNQTNTNTNQTDSYLKSGSTLASNSKQNSDFNEDSDSSSDESICDEELARKLQKEEEIDAKQRVTRSNRSTNNRKKTKTNKSKKRKTDKSDNSYNEKSQKKAKNGYLKPCLLSPILADFLGENEVNNNRISHILSHIKSMNENHCLLLFPFRMSYLRIFREKTFLSRNEL